MGWFLTRSNGKSSRSRRGKRRSSTSPRPWDPARTLLMLKLLAGVGIIVGLVIGWVQTERALITYATEQHAEPVNADQVVLDERPGWMSDAVVAHVRRVVAEQLDGDPLDALSLSHAAQALAVDAWVERVHQVCRDADGSVRVAADFRRPVAVVRGRHGYHLVDARGIRLPGLYESHQVPLLSVPQITGVQRPAPSRAGLPWPGEDLRDGLRLAELIEREPYADQVQAIDVSHRDRFDRLRLVLYTEHGQVVWGLPVGQETAIEPDAPIKLARLRKVVEARGSLDAGGRLVKVYGPATEISRAPLHTASAE